MRRALALAVVACLGCDPQPGPGDSGPEPADAPARLDGGAGDASSDLDGDLDASAELDASGLDAPLSPATWDGATWDGALWDGALWDGALWDDALWDGALWDGATWDGALWDGATWDGATWDGSLWDGGVRDAGRDARAAGGCVSGAAGTRAVRFRWEGSGAGSTAYVRYEANDLPDTSRWRVTANSRSIGYRPVFDDVFLGEGGLDFGGTVFMDVELSTVGLASLGAVTIAVYGRSFNTTSSGSFTWQTFDGTGAAPRDLVANSAPYEWYLADATTEFSPGDDGVLLRLYPGPSSGRLVVNRVEICFAE